MSTIWTLISLGLQLFGSILVALDVFNESIEEAFNHSARIIYRLGMRVTRNIIVGGVAIILIFWEISELYIGGFIEPVSIIHSENILEIFTSLSIGSVWVSIARQQVMFSFPIWFTIPVCFSLLFILYTLIKYSYASSNYERMKRRLNIKFAFLYTLVLQLLIGLPIFIANMLELLSIILVILFPIVILLSPLAISYRLAQSGYVASELRFVGFILLIAGFIIQIIIVVFSS